MRILALDCGTTLIKAGVFDIGRPPVVKAPSKLWIENAVAPATETTMAGRDRSHLDVDHYLKRVFGLLQRVSEQTGPIDALCLAVCCPALVPLDSSFRPLYPALTHFHQASQPQARELADTLGRELWLSRAGNLPVPGGISASSLHWLMARRPRVVAGTRYWVHLHSVLLHSLTGRLITDPTQAAYTGLYDSVGATGWLDDDWLESIGLAREQLPGIVPSASVAGPLTGTAARAAGLAEGLPVITGGADIPAALLAAGEVFPEAALNM
ncbi:MAG: FGGY family carbohydrate kinase, partial [Gemmatimonadota bacterium]|nr:FGGY family carbohydrate kinase [Gemmatimonadota bacterium]